MSTSYSARHYRSEVCISRRVFHGVERPEYEDVMNLAPKEARDLAALLIEAADRAEAYDRAMAGRSLAAARERLCLAQAEVDALAKIAGKA